MPAGPGRVVGPKTRLAARVVADRERGIAYPWESPAVDLKAAEDLINKCGYHRRDEELAHAKQAIGLWTRASV